MNSKKVNREGRANRVVLNAKGAAFLPACRMVWRWLVEESGVGKVGGRFGGEGGE